jgi:hypothetical protein
MIVFTDHAAWRTAERHMGSVDLGLLGREIEAALDGGWSGRTQQTSGQHVVTIRGGERFVVAFDDPRQIVVVTALGRLPR